MGHLRRLNKIGVEAVDVRALPRRADPQESNVANDGYHGYDARGFRRKSTRQAYALGRLNKAAPEADGGTTGCE